MIYDNMLDNHPPFQIDGNFGGAAGIAEMLIQSQNGYISLLPAVTDDFNGSFTRLRARGNIEVSAEFKKGRVTKTELLSRKRCTVRLEQSSRLSRLYSEDGNEIFPENGIYTVELKGGVPSVFTTEKK